MHLRHANLTELPISGQLDTYLQSITYSEFEQLCVRLLKAEGVHVLALASDLKTSANLPPKHVDVLGTMTVREWADFERVEMWGFEIKHFKRDRLTLDAVLEADALTQHRTTAGPDYICLVSSGEATSVLREIVKERPLLRLWDRLVLHHLIDKHKNALNIPGLPASAASIPGSAMAKTAAVVSPPPKTKFDEFQERLDQTPSGQADYAKYEAAVIDILRFLFGDKLGTPQIQAETKDETQRRDILFRNHQMGRFWKRIYDLFAADFLIVDAKNYADPLKPNVLDEVAKYPNKALGRFLLVISRKGGNPNMQSAQVRYLRDDPGKMLVVIGDEQLLEMVRRKEVGEVPEDVIEDAMDVIKVKY